jgi:adenosine deaminase
VTIPGDRTGRESADTFIARLPKAELHVHLEGTLEPEMMLGLAARNGVDLPWSNIDELRREYRFSGLEHFLRLLFQGAQVLRHRQDFFDLTLAYLNKAAAQGVQRAEVFFGAQTFLDAGVPIADQLDGVLDAIHTAAQSWDIDAAVILTVQRHRTQRDALELFDLVQPWADRILGFGLGAAERGNPPGKFAEYFGVCRARGFRTTIHAGEDAPAAYVWEALDVCKPDRIDHGTTAVADQQLVARLRDMGITLTMCPLSNVALRVVPSIEQHPLAQLLRAGVRVTVNSDDPPYFGGYINDNYAAVHTGLDLTTSELGILARNSFLGSFDSPENIARAVASVDEYIAVNRQVSG